MIELKSCMLAAGIALALAAGTASAQSDESPQAVPPPVVQPAAPESAATPPAATQPAATPPAESAPATDQAPAAPPVEAPAAQSTTPQQESPATATTEPSTTEPATASPAPVNTPAQQPATATAIPVTRVPLADRPEAKKATASTAKPVAKPAESRVTAKAAPERPASVKASAKADAKAEAKTESASAKADTPVSLPTAGSGRAMDVTVAQVSALTTFEGLDQNKDQGLAKEEVVGDPILANFFAEWDQDKNGTLSSDEYNGYKSAKYLVGASKPTTQSQVALSRDRPSHVEGRRPGSASAYRNTRAADPAGGFRLGPTAPTRPPSPRPRRGTGARSR
jgi:hypothetical protein